MTSLGHSEGSVCSRGDITSKPLGLESLIACLDTRADTFQLVVLHQLVAAAARRAVSVPFPFAAAVGCFTLNVPLAVAVNLLDPIVCALDSRTLDS